LDTPPGVVDCTAGDAEKAGYTAIPDSYVVGTLAAIWVAMLTPCSVVLYPHAATSITTLLRDVSAR
jgi:hypothetical protein